MRTIIRTTTMVLSLACLSAAMVSTNASAQSRPAAAPSTPAAAPMTPAAPATRPAPAPQPPAAPAPQAGQADEAPLKQVALTDKMIENALAANAELSPIVDKLPEDGQPDPKVLAQLDGIAKKRGFASYQDYDVITSNINLVMSGFDPETKKFIGQDAVLKKEIAQVQADKKMPANEKKETLGELNEALKSIIPLQFPQNADVVGKYLDKLMVAMPQDKQ